MQLQGQYVALLEHNTRFIFPLPSPRPAHVYALFISLQHDAMRERVTNNRYRAMQMNVGNKEAGI